jgi:hypothetical protein
MTNSVIQDAIILILESHEGEIAGTEALANEANCINNKTYLLQCVRIVQSNGHVQIIPSNGGRGHKTIYRCTSSRCNKCPRTCKRNRNQPGLPRKIR